VNYKRMWNTLKAESGHRQTITEFVPTGEDNISLLELMERMEARDRRVNF